MTGVISAADLRRLAEERIIGQQADIPTTADPETLRRLLHELQVHQIELEIQNDTLRQTQIALEESHAQYVDLYEFAPLGYVTVDSGGRITRINLTGAELLGLARSELLNKHLSSFMLSGDADLWHRHFKQSLRDGKGSSLEITLQRGDGSVFAAQLVWVRENTSRDDSAYGLPGVGPCLRIALYDISQRKALEHEQMLAREALRKAKAEAERANDSKSRFLAAASHDLRQPVAALRLYIDLLKDHVTPENQALVAGMEDCISIQNRLLTDLLDLSKLAAGATTPRIVDFSVFELLASVESVYFLEAKSKGLRLHFAPTCLTGRSDPVLIKRILGNLIDNAIRYTERGSVLVGCRRRQGKNWIEVRDSGIGIPAEQTAAIFEEFKQLGDQARNRGSGLGLAIVAKTAALLGLEINVRSWQGLGSVFAIELPLGQPELVLPPTTVQHEGSCRPLRIALVDDNTLVRESLVMALRGSGHKVIGASSGSILLDELGNLPPDIVISDYRLADGETGYDVISTLRQALNPSLPAIIITGDTAPELISSMRERGIAVLYKPVDIAELKTSLKTLTDLRSTCPTT